MFKGIEGTAPFLEHPYVDVTNSKGNEFAIVLSDNFTMIAYCECLLSKICTLDKSQVKPFLEYQCTIVTEPIIWLNKLEKLIDLNDEHYISKKQKLNIDKASDSINLIRERLETQKKSVKKKRYDFNEVKLSLDKYQTDEDKISFMMEERAVYQQNKPKNLKPNETPFDEKINIEINLIKSKRKLHKEKITQQKQGSPSPKSPKKDSLGLLEKLPFNGQTNQLVTLFYEFTRDKIVDGKPLLPWTPQQTIMFLCNNFKDDKGNALSESTVQTVLNPAREEKRADTEKRIKFKYK